MGVVRIKPLGAGGGGVEKSAINGVSCVKYNKYAVGIQNKVY